MILIRNRDEMKGHLEHLVSMAEGQIRSIETTNIGYRTSKESLARYQGRLAGLKESLELIEAWERYDQESA